MFSEDYFIVHWLVNAASLAQLLSGRWNFIGHHVCLCSCIALLHCARERKSITTTKLTYTALELSYGSCWPTECHLKGCPICKLRMRLLSRCQKFHFFLFCLFWLVSHIMQHYGSDARLLLSTKEKERGEGAFSPRHFRKFSSVILCVTFPKYLTICWCGLKMQQERPSIPGDISPELAFIVQSCWVEDPNMRPSFSQIIRMLNAYLFTLPPPSQSSPSSPKSDTTETATTSNSAITEFSSRARGKFGFLRQLFAAKRAKNSQ